MSSHNTTRTDFLDRSFLNGSVPEPIGAKEVGATFVDGDEILVGTHLLRRHRVTIDFVAETVKVVRVK